MLKISIVILNWNGYKDTLECLKSIRKLQIREFELELVVVDNASADKSIEKIMGNKLNKDVKVIGNIENLGFAGGNNVGMKYAIEKGADFILVLNNDTTVKNNLIVELLDAAERHKDAGILTPLIYFYPGFEFHKERYTKTDAGHVIWAAGGMIDWDNVLASNFGVDDTDIGQYITEYERDFATGACMFIRREVIEQIGYFDEKYFLYLEDADYSVRAKRAGWKVIFVPEARIWHKVSQSSSIGGDLNDYFISRNRLLFGMRYVPLRAKFALFRESLRLLGSGREWQKRGVKDFFAARFGKGSWK